MRNIVLSILPAVLASAVPGGPVAAATTAAAGAADRYAAIERLEFNRRAVEWAEPLFWISDANRDGALDPEELEVIWGLGDAGRERFVQDGAFTTHFKSVYEKLRQPPALAGLDGKERQRREVVLEELAQGRPTLVRTTLDDPRDQAFIARLEKVARLMERLHARQNGVLGLDARIPADDTSSRALFFRNQGPFCAAPRTETNPACSALAERPSKVSGLYPASIQARPGFCEALEARKDAVALFDPFVVVRHKEGGRAEGNPATDDLVAVPYHVAFADDMRAVSQELLAAARVLEADASEAAARTYLEAAAQAFLDDSWFKADVAWKAMTATNSKWYLRIAPDEVYFEPCSRKAGFAITLARINPDSLAWQKKLDPVKGEMEAVLARLAGPPYEARNVGFDLPDFIDIVLNAGYSRHPLGAVVGQSLPNWGPVAESGGRTVAMTNLYTDPDSEAALLEQATSLFCKATMQNFDPDPRHLTLSTLLHEAAHNLGPAHEYRVAGRKDGEVFGGSLASMLEELKSQTAGLYFADWLAGRGLLDPADAGKTHVRDVAWAFGHIAQGMTTADGKPKAYSQLAAIQMGFFNDKGVLPWRPTERAANGKDVGCFDVDLAKWQPAQDELARLVLGIKSRGDRALAEQTRDAWVAEGTAWAELRGVIKERWLRGPKAAFVYGIGME